MSNHSDMNERNTIKLVARATSETECRTEIKVRQFVFHTDEPTDEGGTDEAANPVEVLLGALAGCVNVVAHRSAERIGIELRSLRLTVIGELEPELGPAIRRIDIRMEADLEADADQKRRWLEMTEAHCPIAQTLIHGTEVHLDLIKKQRDICC